MNWIWRNFLSFICYPFMSADKLASLDEFYFHKYVTRKRKRRMRRNSKRMKI